MDLNRIKKNIIIDDNGCWVWQKSRTSAGYGQLTENKKYWTAHRYAYTCVHGEIPDSLVVRHLCRNTRCCNPDHLQVGTQTDNWHDSEHIHRQAQFNCRFDYIVNGVTYKGIREANSKTGLSQNSLAKFTDPVTRIFDIDAYHAGCKIANVKPKL